MRHFNRWRGTFVNLKRRQREENWLCMAHRIRLTAGNRPMILAGSNISSLFSSLKGMATLKKKF